MPDDLRRTAAGGVAWTASSQAARQAIQIVVTSILAWNLAPADFGLIGMAAVALALTAPLNEMGLSAALIQRKDLRPGHAVVAFWCQVGVASILGGALALAAPLVATFFHREDVIPLLRVLCLGLPLGAAAATPQALLQRQMRFGRMAGIETLAQGIAGALSVVMAFSGYGVWSLVAQSLTGSFLSAALFLGAARFNPFAVSGFPRTRDLRDLLAFGAPLIGYQVLNFVSRNIDDILIGRFLGAESLGYYTMAYRVMMYPLEKVTGVIGRVTFPAFSSIQEDPARLRRGYVKVAECIALTTFPLMTVMIIAAPAFTRVIFGPAWDPAAPLIAVLSLAGMAASVGSTTGNIFLARGRSDLMLRWEMVASVCYTIAIVAGLSRGLMGVAVAYTVTSLILWPISHAVANRLIDLRLADFYRTLVPPAALAAVIAAALLALQAVWGPSAATTASASFLAAVLSVTAIVVAAAAALGRPAAVAEALSLAREALRGARG